MAKVASIILLIWFLCILAVLPSTFAHVIYKFHFWNTDVVVKEICAEKWSDPYRHLMYSIGLMVVQVINLILIIHSSEGQGIYIRLNTLEMKFFSRKNGRSWHFFC